MRLKFARHEFQHLLQDRLAIAHNTDIHRAVVANFSGIDVDLNHLGIRVKAGRLAMRNDVVEARG